ncbi:ABC-2 family transporter protein [Cohnella sp. AR92]|uniref:ABC transporter permease n=1 Tax=Cohnella sp. AR92 TaxID=648716 RepID=UPI000F8E2039|nr:ABC-2 family transporter protein [Cohnella sp. AR92]RUS43904.1 hypothetical protein ELR57_23845 [Cohnella sp. AR92]
MRKYWEMMKSQIKIDTTYSAWYWAGTVSMLLKMLLVYAFWHAVYENRASVNDMPLHAMITYVVLAMLLNNYVAGVGVQLAGQVRDGSVAIELMRPYNLLDKLVALDLGTKITGTIREGLPLLLIAYLFIGIDAPATWTALPLSIASAAMGVLIGTQLDLVLGVAAFWLHYIWGLHTLRSAFLLFFTGALAPVSMFPDWLRTASGFMPFQSMVYVPAAIYTGQLAGGDALTAILVQAGWLVFIYAAIRFSWKLAIRKVVIFGG